MKNQELPKTPLVNTPLANTPLANTPLANTLASQWPEIGETTAPLVRNLITRSHAWRIQVERSKEGCVIVDCGINCPGSIEAGIAVAEICMGGMGTVDIVPSSRFKRWKWDIHVRSSNPVLACLASQYAGWNLQAGKFSCLGSGPARAQAGREELLKEIGYRSQPGQSVLVLEVDSPPPAAIIEKICHDCHVEPQNVTLILTPTTSLAGTVQVIARVLEVALHKAHSLKFPLEHIIDGVACAPLAPPGSDFLQAMGRTNDAIIYGGQVHLFVGGEEEEAATLAKNLPSTQSHDYGKPFATIFHDCKGDFYAIDPHIFSPADVTLTALKSGRTFHGGACNEKLLNQSFDSSGDKS